MKSFLPLREEIRIGMIRNPRLLISPFLLLLKRVWKMMEFMSFGLSFPEKQKLPRE